MSFCDRGSMQEEEKKLTEVVNEFEKLIDENKAK